MSGGGAENGARMRGEGGEGLSAESGMGMAAEGMQAPGLSVTLWKEEDALTGQTWEESSGNPGYLYQFLINRVDEEGKKIISDDKEVKVRVIGDGCLAGIDNGDLADVTPFSSDSRKTYRGDLAVYVRRTGTGVIRVSVWTAGTGEADGESGGVEKILSSFIAIRSF